MRASNREGALIICMPISHHYLSARLFVRSSVHPSIVDGVEVQSSQSSDRVQLQPGHSSQLIQPPEKDNTGKGWVFYSAIKHNAWIDYQRLNYQIIPILCSLSQRQNHTPCQNAKPMPLPTTPNPCTFQNASKPSNPIGNSFPFLSAVWPA